MLNKSEKYDFPRVPTIGYTALRIEVKIA